MRGDGKTTRQIQAAPAGAIYVWVNRQLSYPLMLCRELGRTDLKVISPGEVEHHLRGVSSPVVVDHAARLPLDTREEIRIHRFVHGHLTT